MLATNPKKRPDIEQVLFVVCTVRSRALLEPVQQYNSPIPTTTTTTFSDFFFGFCALFVQAIFLIGSFVCLLIGWLVGWMIFTGWHSRNKLVHPSKNKIEDGSNKLRMISLESPSVEKKRKEARHLKTAVHRTGTYSTTILFRSMSTTTTILQQ